MARNRYPVKPIFVGPGEDGICWFCERTVKPHRKHRHHLLCRRFWKWGQVSGEGRDHPYNVVDVCVDCHSRWHHQYDDVRWNVEQFYYFMNLVRWGRGIFKEEG